MFVMQRIRTHKILPHTMHVDSSNEPHISFINFSITIFFKERAVASCKFGIKLCCNNTLIQAETSKENYFVFITSSTNNFISKIFFVVTGKSAFGSVFVLSSIFYKWTWFKYRKKNNKIEGKIPIFDWFCLWFRFCYDLHNIEVFSKLMIRYNIIINKQIKLKQLPLQTCTVQIHKYTNKKSITIQLIVTQNNSLKFTAISKKIYKNRWFTVISFPSFQQENFVFMRFSDTKLLSV